MLKINRKALQTAMLCLLFAIGGALPWQNAKAERLWTENFEYDDGDLYQQGGWLKYASNPSAPIQVKAPGLTYAGYLDKAKGGKATITGTASGQDLFARFTNADTEIKSGKLYISFLFNVKEIPTNNTKAYFLCIVPQTANGITDGKSGSEYCKLFVQKTTEGKYNLHASLGGSITKATTCPVEMEVGTTYLVVMQTEIISGEKNDALNIWVNPDISDVEPTPSMQRDSSLDDSADPTMSRGYCFLELRQGATSSNGCPTVEIDAIHVATAWADLFDAQEPPVTTPSISASLRSFRFDYGFTGIPQTFVSTISGENLTENITITLPQDVTASQTTITPEEAAAGKELTFTVTPSEVNEEYERTITLTSGEATLEIPVAGNVMALVKHNNLAELHSLLVDSSQDYTYHLYTGDAVVTALTEDSYGSAECFIQDASGAMHLNFSYVLGYGEPSPVKVGDKITDITFSVVSEEIVQGLPKMFAFIFLNDQTYFTKVSSGNTVEPVEVSMTDFAATSGASRLYQVVKVKGVNFKDAEGKTFAPNAGNAFTDGTNDGTAAVLSPSDLIGQPIPTGTVNLTGVSRAKNIVSLYMRSSADVEEAAAKPVINSSVTEYTFGTAINNMPFTFTSVISGENLEKDITITLPSDITASQTTITPEEAAAGKEVTFTVTPAANDDYARVITLASGEAQFVEIKVTGMVLDVTRVANTQQIFAQAEDPDVDSKFYMYTGKAVITGINAGESVVFYAQDMFGGMKVDCLFVDGFDANSIAVGDELTNICFLFDNTVSGAPVLYLTPFTDEGIGYEKTATGKSKTPAEVTIAEFTPAGAPNYLYRLVTVKDVTFKDVEGGKYLTTEMKITDGEKEGFACAMDNADLVGQNLPAGAVTLTGISDSAEGLTLMLRNSADVLVGAPACEVTSREVLVDFTNTAAPINEDTEVMSYTIKAANLPEALPIAFTGANAEYFSASIDAIPAGSGTHVVKVIYHPTATGKHVANFTIDADAVNPEFNYANQIRANAYDPQNLPAVTVEPADVSLVTNPGKPVTAEVLVNAENCIDYINVTRGTTGNNGGITISTTMLLPDSKDAKLTITFNPTAEGEYSETFTLSTLMCSTPAVITVNGVCEGEREPEEKEGDEFKVSDENPYITYSFDFSEVEHNKPLKNSDWTNVAVKGTRAWWGYVAADEAEPFSSAKATAYDSTLRPDQAEECEMMLISPALNFKDAGDKHLTFDLMGMYLDENQTTKLEVLFGEPNGTEQPDFYPMAGFTIPTTPDEAGKWIPFDVDMSVVEDMPDTFFIAFRLSSMRSSAEPATYYIKNFVWNPSGTAAIDTLGVGDGHYDVYNMQGICVLRDAEATDVKALPAGLYIVNGRKVVIK